MILKSIYTKLGQAEFTVECKNPAGDIIVEDFMINCLDIIYEIIFIILGVFIFFMIIVVIVCNRASNMNETPIEKFNKDNEQMRIVCSEKNKKIYKRKY